MILIPISPFSPFWLFDVFTTLVYENDQNKKLRKNFGERTREFQINVFFVVIICFSSVFAETAGVMLVVVSDGKTAGLEASWALPGPPSKSFPFSATFSEEVGWGH